MEKILEWFLSAYSAPIVILSLLISFVTSVIINMFFGPLEPEALIMTMVICFLVMVFVIGLSRKNKGVKK